MSKKKGLGKFIFGAAVGAGLGLLFAPKTGEETRKDLKKSVNELLDKLKEVDAEEVKENIEKRVEEIKKELRDLDKEKAMSIAKEQAKNIKDMAEELVIYAKKKGTPVLEKSANIVKEKTIAALEATLKNLKETDTSKKKAK